jgi:hypothetical protein
MMPAAPIQPPAEILLLGAAGHWPDPLPQLMSQHLIHFHITPDLYQAAAMLKDESRRFFALLVDPEHLSRRELQNMLIIKRHKTLPIWSLPTRNRKALISELGIIPWEETVRALSQLPLQVITPQSPQCDTQKYPVPFSPDPARSYPPTPPPKADNPSATGPEKRTEIPVASHLADRYDEQSTTPLLTELELRALLGPAD